MQLQRTGWWAIRRYGRCLALGHGRERSRETVSDWGGWQKHGLSATLDVLGASRRTLFNRKARYKAPIHRKTNSGLKPRPSGRGFDRNHWQGDANPLPMMLERQRLPGCR
jgi:hypothetical protein